MLLKYQVKQLEAHNQLCNNFYQMYWNCINYGLFIMNCAELQ